MSDDRHARYLAAGLGAVALGAVIAVVVTLGAERERAPQTAPAAPPVEAAPVEAPRDAATPTRTPEDAGCAHCRAPSLPDAAVLEALPRGVDLSTPEHAIDSQVAMLRTGSDADFLATVLPSARGEVDPASIAECREDLRRMRYTVEPAWDMAVRDTERGVAFVRLPMIRRSGPYTTFYNVGGRWYADWAWCRIRAEH
ncbi:MAG: hypothetical protein JNK72_09235 [Myxococcales bacterium]|nr:hypothetical protein [Myxococcales bacterium]